MDCHVVTLSLLAMTVDLFRNRRFRVTRSDKNPKIADFGRVLSDPFMGFERTLVKLKQLLHLQAY